MTDVTVPFATVQDLQARWPDFPPGAEATAEVQLDDASQFILDVCPNAVNATENTRRRVVCSVVRRAMQASASDMVGLTSTEITTGPFSASYQSSNPNGDFFLTKQEMKALGGGGRPRAFGVQVGGFSPADGEHVPWCDTAWGLSCSCGASLTREGPLWELD